MGTKRRILIIAVLLVMGGGLGWLVLRPGEPKYQGKPLSYWLQAYDIFGRAAAISNHTYHGPSPVEAAEALRQIGTNAFPKLLQMLQANDANWKVKLMALGEKQHVIKIHFVHSWSRNFEALTAFRMLIALGTDLKPIVPQLVTIYGKNISFESTNLTAGVLARLNPPSKEEIPVLRRQWTKTDELARFDSLMGCWLADCIQPDPVFHPVVLLLRDLKNKNEESHIGLLLMVQPEDGLHVQVVASELVEGLHDPLPAVRQMACFALQKVYSEGNAIPEADVTSALVETLRDPDPLVRNAASRVLKRLDPKAAAKAGVQ